MDSRVGCLIDWFKFSINKEFDPCDPLLARLFSLMKLDVLQFDDKGSTGQFGHRYQYGEYFSVLCDPRPDRNLARVGAGENYFFVDMSGDACREFEDNGGDWKELFDFISTFSYHVTRLDIAVDDFGVMDLSKLEEHIDSHHYLSCFRATAKVVYHPVLPADPDLFDGPDSPVVIRKDQGHGRKSWSATFGTRQSVTLQFYDKLMERAHARVGVPLDQWIRAEMRFFNNKGDPAFVECRLALDRGEFSQFALSLLNGLIQIKQETVGGRARAWDLRQARRFDVWSDWSSFIGSVGALKIKSLKSEVPDCMKIEHLKKWMSVAAARTMAMMLAASPETFLADIQDMVKDFVSEDKFGHQETAFVNALLKKYGLPPSSLKGCLEVFDSCLGTVHEKEKGSDEYVIDSFDVEKK